MDERSLSTQEHARLVDSHTNNTSELDAQLPSFQAAAPQKHQQQQQGGDSRRGSNSKNIQLLRMARDPAAAAAAAAVASSADQSGQSSQQPIRRFSVCANVYIAYVFFMVFAFLTFALFSSNATIIGAVPIAAVPFLVFFFTQKFREYNVDMDMIIQCFGFGAAHVTLFAIGTQYVLDYFIRRSAGFGIVDLLNFDSSMPVPYGLVFAGVFFYSLVVECVKYFGLFGLAELRPEYKAPPSYMICSAAVSLGANFGIAMFDTVKLAHVEFYDIYSFVVLNGFLFSAIELLCGFLTTIEVVKRNLFKQFTCGPPVFLAIVSHMIFYLLIFLPISFYAICILVAANFVLNAYLVNRRYSAVKELEILYPSV